MVNDSALSVYISSNLEEQSLKTSEKQWAHKLPWLETDKKIGNNKLKEQHNAGTYYLGVRARVCVNNYNTIIRKQTSGDDYETMNSFYLKPLGNSEISA